MPGSNKEYMEIVNQAAREATVLVALRLRKANYMTDSQLQQVIQDFVLKTSSES